MNQLNNVKIGVLMPAYNMMEYLKDGSIDGWLQYKEKYSDTSIAVVESRFAYFEGPPKSTDGTTEFFNNLLSSGKIDFFDSLEPNQQEKSARTVPLKKLMNCGVDYVICPDPDEFFSLKEIEDIVSFITKDPFIAYYHIEYKNYVFDKNTYTKGFAPKRIYKTKYLKYVLHEFYGDNDICYLDTELNKVVSDSNFSSKVIPNIKIKHYSWLNNDTSRKKVEYQSERWHVKNGGFGCGFKWNYEKKCLEFNEEYYKLTKQQIPVLYKDE